MQQENVVKTEVIMGTVFFEVKVEHEEHNLAALKKREIHFFLTTTAQKEPLKISKQWQSIYDSVADFPESWVWVRADFQSGSSVLKKVFWALSISMAYNLISCQKVAENTQILKIAKFAM